MDQAKSILRGASGIGPRVLVVRLIIFRSLHWNSIGHLAIDNAARKGDMLQGLCAICTDIFTGEQRLNHELPHHQDPHAFLHAAKDGCYICRIITTSGDWKFIATQKVIKAVWYLSRPADTPSGFFRLSIDTLGQDDELALDGAEEEGPDGSDDDMPATPMAWGFHIQPVSGELDSPIPQRHRLTLTASVDLNDSIGAYVPPLSPEDPALADLARTWFEECCETHPSCGPRDFSFRPTRLVEIVDENQVRVVLAQNDTDLGAYAAFSHCWGKARALKLLQANVTQLCSSVLVEDLPTSYREAISMCLTLSIRYIWIDSLCIIQDSEEDWQREAATMRDVYRNSSLNICACAAADSSESSFTGRDCSLITPLKVSSSWDGVENRQYYLSDAEIYQKDIEDSPLRTRAWVLQEVWLSRRSLSLTRSQLWWECRQRRACESFPGGVPATWLSQDLANNLNFHQLHPHEESHHEPRTMVQLHRAWSRLVELYSRCGLTVMLDKMMAFSGIAQGFKQTENPDDDYIAGMWGTLLPASLYWSTMKLEWTRRPEVYRAPSWSWASIEGAVGFPPDLDRERDGGSDVKLLSRVVDVRLKLVGEDHETGLLAGAAMKIQGKLIGPVTADAPEYTLKCVSSSNSELDEALQVARWGFDETTEEGGDALSYLDEFDFNTCRDGVLDGASRKTVLWDSETKIELFCLPIFESFHGNAQSMRGLLLCRVGHQPRDVYHRVGDFSHLPVLEDALASIEEQTIVLL